MPPLQAGTPTIQAVTPPVKGIMGAGVEFTRLKFNKPSRLSLMIHAFELSGLSKICRALNGPAPMSKLWTEFGAAGGQPAGTAPVVTTSIAGESAATAPVPLGIALISVGLFAGRGGTCTSVWSQVEST